MWRVLLRSVLLVMVLVPALPVSADTIAVSGLSGEQLTALAAELIEQNRLDDAALILDQLEQQDSGGTEREFLQGVLAVAQGRFYIAIDRFQAILDREPGLTVVRLELARVRYMVGDYSEADRQLRLARDGEPPAEIESTIRRMGQLIRQRRPWHFDMGFSLTPDTNINGATRHDRVDIYGLPFVLDDSSRAHSGVGIAMNLRGGYRLRQDEAVPIYLGASGYLQQYKAAEFNDDSMDVEAGPEFTTAAGRLKVSATYLHRWYGGSLYQNGPGLRLTLTNPASGSWPYGLRVDVRDLSHPQREFLDGSEYSSSVWVSHVFGSDVHASLWLGLRYQDAAYKAYGSRHARLGVELSRELAWGLRGGVGFEFGRTSFDDEMPAFGVRRKDHFHTYSATVTKSGWNIAGFVPVFRLVKFGRDSTLASYETGKWRGEIGLTQSF